MLPFGNNVVEREVTGAQLWAMLENGVSQVAADGTSADGRFPQISGFRSRSDVPPGSRVQSVQCDDGTPIPPDSTHYTLVTNDFVNSGGDFYSMLADGHGHVRDVMFNTVLDYVRNQGTITPTTEGRITRLN